MPVPPDDRDDLECHYCDKRLPCIKWRTEFHKESEEPFFCDTCNRAFCKTCVILLEEEQDDDDDDDHYVCQECYEN